MNDWREERKKERKRVEEEIKTKLKGTELLVTCPRQ